MLQSKDMRLPEFDEDLPHSDMDQRVSPAEKYSQLGESAAAALISSTVATLPAGHPCCVVVDTSPKTGEFARTILRAPASSTALHYIAVGLESQLAWCQQDLKDFALGLYLARALKIKNFEPLPDTLSADETPDLVLPKLNVGVVDGTNLVVAPDVCDKWASSSFKDDWKALQEEMNQLLPPKESTASPNTKRQRVEVAERVTPEDSPSVALKPVTELDATKMMLQANGIGKLKGVTFQLYPANVMVLLNSTASDVALTGQLTGWNKGRWWQPKEAEEQFDPSVDLIWQFSQSSEMVVMDGTALSLYQVMEETKRQKPEKAVLRYHVMKDKVHGGCGPGDFDIECKHPVAWRAERAVVEGDSKKQNPGALASLIPADVWNLNVVQIVWAARWAKQGLCGIKPMIWLKGNVVIPPQHFVQLTAHSD